ncbi:MAG: hypothetical protein E8D48_08120 [Nitrospira sp.]|nr:MAG: hypothetical protein E8D48_08120 [Nitrospira sp.]
MLRGVVLFGVLLAAPAAFAADFSCPAGLTIKEGVVPHPWFDDVAIPSKWCVDSKGIKNGPWWGWDPKTNTVVFRGDTLAGEPHGKYRMYFTNGAVAEEGQMDHGKKVGKWVAYKSDGIVESETTY